MNICARHIRRAALAVVICGLAASGAFAQPETDSPIDLTVALDRLEAVVGDVFTLNVEITYDTTYTVLLPEYDKSLGSFEIQDGSWSDSERGKNGRGRITGEFKLWALETGEAIIPQITVQFSHGATDSDTTLQNQSVSSAPVKALVKSSLSDSDSTLAPMTDPLEDPLALSDVYEEPLNWPLLLGVAVLVLAALGGATYYLKRKTAPGQIDLRDPWEIAFERLAGLSNASYLAEGRFKDYYSDLTGIFKEFLGQTLAVNALDMTTGEALTALSANDLTTAHVERARTVLNQADLVKFARMTPPPGRPQEDFSSVHQVIDSVKAEILERRRIEEEMHKAEKARAVAENATEEQNQEASHV